MGLSARNLHIELGEVAILSDVSANFQAGQITAICGPNGAGKSTLLTALAGLTDLDRGEVSLDHTPLSSLHAREKAKQIGYLPQTSEVAWDVCVTSLIALGRLPHGDAGEAAVKTAMAKADLTAFANRPISSLSGGERARALLARVLAVEPGWILADEPLAALDLAHQLIMLRQLRDEAESGCGVVIVLHDLALAMNHADHVVVLYKGRVAAEGAAGKALDSAIIKAVWGVENRWLGEPGNRALVAQI